MPDVAQNSSPAQSKPPESVWDFPRPPRLEQVDWRIRVMFAGETVVDSPTALRVLETSQAPAYYVPFEYVNDDLLRPNAGRRTFCEWKGLADYADIVVGERVAERAGWSYAQPSAGFASLAGHWAFYAQSVDECWVDDDRVDPNEGDFYGGWITPHVTGPFKGGPGTLTW